MALNEVKQTEHSPDSANHAADALAASEAAQNTAKLAQAKLTESALLSHAGQALVTHEPLPHHLTMTDPFNNYSDFKAPVSQAPELPKDTFDTAYEWASGAADVISLGVKGTVVKAWNSVVEHPGSTLLTVGEGVAIGAAIIAAAPVAAALGAGTAVVAGVGLAAEATMFGLSAVGAVTTAEGLYDSVLSSSASVGVLMNKSAHSQSEIEAARKDCQSKLGEAGINVAEGAFMVLGGAASGIKIASRIGAATKSGEKVAALLVPETALPSVTIGGDASLSNASIPSIVKAEVPIAKAEVPVAKAEVPIVKAEVPIASGPVDAAHLESVAPVGTSAAKDVTLPPGSIERFSSRLDNFLRSSEKKLDVEESEKNIAELQKEAEELRMNLALNLARESQAAGDSSLAIYSKELADVDTTRGLLKKYPESSEIYEKYLANRTEQAVQKALLDGELTRRRDGVASIMNEEAKNLFPAGAVPEISVEQLPAESHASASYANGVVRLPNSAFYTTNELLRGLKGNDLPGMLVHEMKHGEQDGIMIRQYIDGVTGSDTTGRTLTAAEKTSIIEKYARATGRTLPEKIVDEINLQRSGRPLSAEEVSRAKAIETGRKSQLEEGGLIYFESARIKQLLSEKEDLDVFPDTALDILNDEDKLNELFRGNVPENVRAIHDELSEITKNGDDLPYDDFNFLCESAETLSNAIDDAVKDAQANIQAGHLKYRGWEHEQESWQAGAEVDQRLGVPDAQTQTVMMKNLFDTLFGREEFSVEDVKNPANVGLFEKLESARTELGGEENSAFEHVLFTLQHEQNSLHDPAVSRSFIDKFADEVENDNPDSKNAYLHALNIVREFAGK